MRKKWYTTPLVLSAVVLASAATLGACGGDKATEQFNDAPRGSTNDDAADVMTFPDGFSNVASKCDGPNRVYVLFKADKPYGAIDVVQNDPRCGTATTAPN